ncbi:MAG TPA: UxaA family hydrolase [Methanomassiliicoccales archaeon]|nr:UxaA family hydrolase [Methanomassiliicoccales archaeon]
MGKAIVLSARDNVATALDELNEGEEVTLRNGEEKVIKILQDIPFGHKFATRNIQRGEEILKYGEVIAKATVDIKEGGHVHVQNVESLRGRGDLTPQEE